MGFAKHVKKGINQCLIDIGLPADALHFHISEVAPMTSSHAPHQHDGVEAVFVLAGEATLSIEQETVRLETGEAVIFDPQRLHGLANTGSVQNRYMVIISRPTVKV